MTIYLGKVSDYTSFQYRFLSEGDLNALKDRRIAQYRAMIKAIEEDTRDFERYLRYERKLRKMILSERYTYERLKYLMARVREMRWMIEEEFGQIDGQSISVLPSPEGYAEYLWKNARDSAIAKQHQAERSERYRKMHDAINRGEASYDNFCPDCCHKWEETDVDEWIDYEDEVIHQTWYCPECTKTLWRDKEF